MTEIDGVRATSGRGAGGPIAPRDPVEKALEVLRYMIDDGAETYGVRELSRAIGRPPSTVYRALTRLESEGLVALSAGGGGYSVGLEMVRLSAKVSSRFSLRDAATGTLTELRNEYDETASLGLLDHHRLEVVMVAAVESRQALRYVVEVNEWRPLYRGASALSVLAYLSDELCETALKRLDEDEDPPLTEAGIRSSLREIRQAGYACTVGQRRPDVVGIAAPVFDPGGSVAGCVALSMPSSRFDRGRKGELAGRVKDAARRVTGKMIGAPTLR